MLLWSFLLEVPAQRSVSHESFSPQSTDLYFTAFENRVPQASGVLLWLHMNMISYNSSTDGDMDGKAKGEILMFMTSQL